MTKLYILTGLLLSSVLAMAQEVEQSRLLAVDYQSQPLEEAITTLTATNTIGMSTSAEYKAGQSVVLQPGFEAKAGSVFTAHIGAVSAENEFSSLSIKAYPNPFEQLTTITYVLTKPSRISLGVHNAEGKLISQLVDNLYQETGRYSVEWQGKGAPVGTYIFTLDMGFQRLSGRIIRK